MLSTLVPYVEVYDSKGCYSKCGSKGGLCPSVCGENGYCCSGKNHVFGNGPVKNGDCPQQAIDIMHHDGHSCAVPLSGEKPKHNDF